MQNTFLKVSGNCAHEERKPGLSEGRVLVGQIKNEVTH